MGGSVVLTVKSTMEAPSSAPIELGGASANFSVSFDTYLLGTLSDILGTEIEKEEKVKIQHRAKLDQSSQQGDLIRPFKRRLFTAFEANPEGAVLRPYLINSSSLTTKALGQGSFLGRIVIPLLYQPQTPIPNKEKF